MWLIILVWQMYLYLRFYMCNISYEISLVIIVVIRLCSHLSIGGIDIMVLYIYIISLCGHPIFICTDIYVISGLGFIFNSLSAALSDNILIRVDN